MCPQASVPWEPPLLAPISVPNQELAPQTRAPGQASRPLSQKDWGCVSVCCICSALEVVTCQGLSLRLVQFYGIQGPGSTVRQWKVSLGWWLWKNKPTNKPRSLDSAKVLFILTRLEFTDADLQDGVAACLPPGESYGRTLNMSVRLDAFPSSQCFTVSKWAASDGSPHLPPPPPGGWVSSFSYHYSLEGPGNGNPFGFQS